MRGTRTLRWLTLTLAVMAGFQAWAMTYPPFATPMVNRALEKFGPPGAHVDKAWFSFPALHRLNMEGFIIPERMAVRSGRLGINPLGFLPGVVWVSSLTAAEGEVIVGATGPDGEEPSRDDLARYVDQFHLTDIAVRMPGDHGAIAIYGASGSIQDGSLQLEAAGASARLSFTGNAQASSLRNLKGHLKVNGDNLAEMAALVGLAAPDTPPFAFDMNVDLDSDSWVLKLLAGRVGDSDLTGNTVVDVGRDVPFISASLKSDVLDFDDLGIVFGIPVGTGTGETVGPAQEAAKAEYRRQPGFIPDAEIDFSRLDAVDGEIQYTATNVQDAIFDIASLSLKIAIDGRVVEAREIKAAFPEGSITTYVTIDGTQQPAHTTVRGRLDDVPFKSLQMHRIGVGTLQADFDFATDGDGFQQAAATAEGEIALWSEDARLRAMLVEAAGLDLGEMFALAASGDSEADPVYTDASCLVTRLDINQGVAVFAPGVVDTEDSLLLLDGQVDIGRERLDFIISAHAKDVSVGTLMGDAQVSGTFRNPEVGADASRTLVQGLFSGLLASLSGPLAALPFIDPGAAEDAPCAELYAQARANMDRVGRGRAVARMR